MIPTIMLAGLIVGVLPRRWALIGVVALTFLWPVYLATSGATSTFGETVLAVALALVNVSIGAALSQFIVRPLARNFLQNW